MKTLTMTTVTICRWKTHSNKIQSLQIKTLCIFSYVK